MENLKKAEENFHKYLDDEIQYVFERQTDLSANTIAMDLSKLKDKRFKKIFNYYDPKLFCDKYDEEGLEKIKDSRKDPEEDILYFKPLYIDKVAEYCDEKVFLCPRCKKLDMNFIEIRQHVYECPKNYIRNYFYPELTYEAETNGELKTYGQQYIKKENIESAAFHNVPNQSIFFEEHIKAAKENPAFNMFVTLLENEIRERTEPIRTKEDQKRVLEEKTPDDLHIRKTEIKEDKSRIYMVGGERIWGTELKKESLTMKFTFVEQKLFNTGVDGAY